MFDPVELVNQSTGRRYVARSAVDLNDRLANGYSVPLPEVAPVPEKTFAPSYRYLSEYSDAGEESF